MSTETYLVYWGTSRQGFATIKGLLDSGVPSSNVIGTSRNPGGKSAAKLNSLGVKVLAVDFKKSPASIKQALVESKATRVWFLTECGTAGWNQAKETQQGYEVIDAIKSVGSQVNAVCFSSVGSADVVDKRVHHFWAKADVEKRMKETFTGGGTSFSILRPTCFLDNFDDPVNYNPLKKGKLKSMMAADCKVHWISTTDVGKASAVMIQDPAKYNGQTIDASAGQWSPNEIVEIVSEVTGTKCSYGLSLPKFVFKWFLNDLYMMVEFFEKHGGYTSDVDKFKELVPSPIGPKEWIAGKGAWANGEKFAAL